MASLMNCEVLGAPNSKSPFLSRSCSVWATAWDSFSLAMRWMGVRLKTRRWQALKPHLYVKFEDLLTSKCRRAQFRRPRGHRQIDCDTCRMACRRCVWASAWWCRWDPLLQGPLNYIIKYILPGKKYENMLQLGVAGLGLSGYTKLNQNKMRDARDFCVVELLYLNSFSINDYLVLLI